MCIFIYVFVNLCVLIGIKGRKQFSKAHIKYCCSKTYSYICWGELLHFLFVFLSPYYTPLHNIFQPKFSKSGQFTYQKVLNWEINFCVTDICKFKGKGTHFSFQCSWVILFILNIYIQYYPSPDHTAQFATEMFSQN